MSNFLAGIHVFTVHYSTPSTERHFPNDKPQGLVLSPTYYNPFMLELSIPTHTDTHILSYADKIPIFS